MIRVQQLKLPVTHTTEELEKKLAKALHVQPGQITSYHIQKRSIDARRKNEVSYVYTVDVKVPDKELILKKVNHNGVMLTIEEKYRFPERGGQKLQRPPIIVGSGPAGLFCAYALALKGYCPIVLERGKQVDERKKDVTLFWEKNILNPSSNVQFGEGGAGTFSDGKLNTLVKDVKGRSRFVLDAFISFGAPEKIGYESKPHIGTDVLIDVIKKMRGQIIELGGTFLFETQALDFLWEDDRLIGLRCQKAGQKESLTLETEIAVLAIGHSARDTFEVLKNQGFSMEAKAFAVGLRVEHPQALISQNQYGKAADLLPPADYKLTANLENGRGVYSFCMCPGGYVVNASSEPGHLAVNGMSYSGRGGSNANSAVIVTVTPDDFMAKGPLGGVAFQRSLEEESFRLGHGTIPQQLFGDFEAKKESHSYGDFLSAAKGAVSFAPLHGLFSPGLYDSFCEGMHCFSRRIPGFDRYDCILSGVESRTSSPVRITRNEDFESNKKGVYPCGEGAGYAGGIMSAAMDGLKTAEALIQKYYI